MHTLHYYTQRNTAGSGKEDIPTNTFLSNNVQRVTGSERENAQLSRFSAGSEWNAHRSECPPAHKTVTHLWPSQHSLQLWTQRVFTEPLKVTGQR